MVGTHRPYLVHYVTGGIYCNGVDHVAIQASYGPIDNTHWNSVPPTPDTNRATDGRKPSTAGKSDTDDSVYDSHDSVHSLSSPTRYEEVPSSN